jgi:hypothetical protein
VTATTAYPVLAPDDAIDATLRGFPDGTFAKLQLSPPASELNVENQWDMSATANVPSGSGAALARASWLGCLADGALAEYLIGNSSNLATAVQGTIVAKLPGGSTQAAGGCGGDVAADEEFGAQVEGLTDQEVDASVNKALQNIGLRAERIDVVRPLGPAIAVQLSVPSVDDASSTADAVSAALDSPPYEYEGVFLEIDGPDGTPLLARGVALRAGTDNVWESSAVGSGDFVPSSP